MRESNEVKRNGNFCKKEKKNDAQLHNTRRTFSLVICSRGLKEKKVERKDT